MAPPLAPSLVLLDDAELFSVQPLALLHLPMVRAGAPFMTSDAPARSPLNVEISAKIPVRDFLVSANIPTGLDCAGLF